MYVEILGFIEESIQDYASSVFSSSTEVLKYFLLYISSTCNPGISSLMHIPLNAAIITDVYKSSRQAGSPIPSTLTQLYTKLCLVMSWRRQLSKITTLNNFTDLSESDFTLFLELSKMAFEGLRKNKVIYDVHFIPTVLRLVSWITSVTQQYKNS